MKYLVHLRSRPLVLQGKTNFYLHFVFTQVYSIFNALIIQQTNSIGQVHRATLKDGTAVVVKVMYPGVEDVFRGDVRTIKMFCEIAQPVHVPPLIEVEKQFMTEFDYRREAEQLDKVRNNMMAANICGDSSSHLCMIPRLSTQCSLRAALLHMYYIRMKRNWRAWGVCRAS